MPRNTYQEVVRQYLIENKTIDTIKAKELIGNARFSSVIHKIRKLGYIITTETEKKEDFNNVTYTLIRMPVVKEIKKIKL